MEVVFWCTWVSDPLVAEALGSLSVASWYSLSCTGMVAVLRAVLRDDSIVLVRIKDRFKHPSGGGWRDIMVRAATAPTHRRKLPFQSR